MSRIDYLALKSGQKFKLPVGHQEFILQVPSGRDLVHLLAYSTYTLKMAQQRQALEGPEASEAVAGDKSLNKRLVGSTVVEPQDLDFTQLTGWVWNKYLQPALRRLSGLDGTVTTPDEGDLSLLESGDTYEQDLGGWRVLMKMVPEDESNRLDRWRPGNQNNVEALEEEWTQFIQHMLDATEAQVVEPDDADIKDWANWPAPRVAALYDVLVTVTGLSVGQFRAVEDRLQPIDEADLAGGADVDSGESDVADDAGRSDSAGPGEADEDSDVSAEDRVEAGERPEESGGGELGLSIEHDD